MGERKLIRLFRILAIAGAVGASALVAWFSLGPPDDAPGAPLLNDKAMHFIAYAVQGALYAAGLSRPRLRSIVFGLTLYGGLIELGQILSPFGRQASLADGVVNALGAAAGAVISSAIVSKLFGRA